MILIPGWYSFEITGGGRTLIGLLKGIQKHSNGTLILAPSNWRDYDLSKGDINQCIYLSLVSTPFQIRFLAFPAIIAFRFVQIFICHLRQLMTFAVKHDPLLILTHNDVISVIFSLLFKQAFKNRKFIIIVPYYHVYPSLLQGGIGGLLTHLTLKFSKYIDIVYTESSYNVTFLSKNYNIQKERIFVAGVGIDYPKYRVNETECIANKKYDAVFIGRVHPLKGIFDLVKAWKKVVECKPSRKLVIVGKGLLRHEEELKNLIKYLSLEDNVRLLGCIPEDQKIRVLHDSKLLIHPSYGECIPLVFLEAMSSRIPVLTYYLPAYRDIKHLIFYVNAGDIDALAHTALNLLEDYEDLARVKIIRAAEYASQHDWTIIAANLVSYLLQISQKT
ncbi:MAG: glycosyltransferase family 4 protein, partial [Candidatus Bathyarchaeia archaeon]